MQSPGVQEELLPVSLVWEVVVLTALARVLLEMYPFDLNWGFSFSSLLILLFVPRPTKTESKDLHWWCNLRLTVWPVTECLLSYAGTHGWRTTESEQVWGTPVLLFLRVFKPPWLWSRCVVEVACLPPPKLGAAGTAGSTQPRSAMPSALLWLPLPFLPLWCPKVSYKNNTCWGLRSFRNTFTLKCLYS